MSSRIVMYGTTWCADCRRSKAFLSRQGVEYDYVDLEEHPEDVDLVLTLNDGMHVVPTIVFPDGSHLSEPSDRQLAEKLGIPHHSH